MVNWSYELSGDGQKFEYHLVLQTLRTGNLNLLAQELARSPNLVGFRLSPSRSWPGAEASDHPAGPGDSPPDSDAAALAFCFSSLGSAVMGR